MAEALQSLLKSAFNQEKKKGKKKGREEKLKSSCGQSENKGNLVKLSHLNLKERQVKLSRAEGLGWNQE